MNNFKNKFLIVMTLINTTINIMPELDLGIVRIGHHDHSNDTDRHHHVRFWKNDHNNSNQDKNKQPENISIKSNTSRKKTSSMKNTNLDNQARNARRKEIENKIKTLEEDLRNV